MKTKPTTRANRRVTEVSSSKVYHMETSGAARPFPRPTPADLENARRIRARLLAAGHFISTIARELSVSRPAVSNTLRNNGGSQRIRTHIAGLLGDDPAKLWPLGDARRRRAASSLHAHATRRARPGKAV
jgi:DNA-binding CsgD family transcriptional regulator